MVDEPDLGDRIQAQARVLAAQPIRTACGLSVSVAIGAVFGWVGLQDSIVGGVIFGVLLGVGSLLLVPASAASTGGPEEQPDD
jgi:hypothetical protein